MSKHTDNIAILRATLHNMSLWGDCNADTIEARGKLSEFMLTAANALNDLDHDDTVDKTYSADFVTELECEINDMQSTITEQQARIAELATRCTTIARLIGENKRLRDQSSDTMSLYTKAKEEIGRLNNWINHVENATITNMDGVKHQRDAALMATDELRDELATTTVAANLAEWELDEAEQELSRRAGTIAQLRDKCDEHSANASKWADRVTRRENDCSRLQSELDTISAEEHDHLEQLYKAAAEIHACRDTIEGLCDIMENMGKEHTALLESFDRSQE